MSSILRVMQDPVLSLQYYSQLEGNVIDKNQRMLIADLHDYWKYRTKERLSTDELVWNLEEFWEWLTVVKHPTLREDKAQALWNALKASESIVLDDTNEIINTFQLRHIAGLIAYEADQIACGESNADLSEVQHILDTYTQRATNHLPDDPGLLELLPDKEGVEGFTWRLECLNYSVGLFTQGDNAVLVARPEHGKTTFLASEVAHFCTQLKAGEVIHWYNNEEDDSQVRRRVYQAYLGWSNEQIHENREQANELCKEIQGKFRVINAHGMSLQTVEEHCQQHNVRCVIFDQLRKMHSKQDGLDAIKELYYGARKIAVRYCAVLSVHQAADVAEGEMWVQPTMMYGVRTEAQGELDIQIMLGASDKTSPHRGINIVKNKGDRFGKAKEIYRHARFEVDIIPQIARYVDTTAFEDNT